ncbi:MAG: tetratricopeptide repeat protein [Chloroflexi bacterium]|nr:tetratricopeptide repeat protein [Chloroflexota bacterium]
MLISRSSPRRPRRRSGCSPFTVLTGALAGLLVIALGWLAGLILPNPQPELVTLDTARRAFDSGDLDDAVEAAEKALAAAPGQPDAVLMLVRGLVYRSYVDWNNEIDRKRALEVATNALLRGGDHPDTLAAQAFALHAAGRYLEAFKAAEKALRANPNHVFARLVYGLAFAGVGSFDRGLIQVQQAAKSADYQVDFAARAGGHPVRYRAVSGCRANDRRGNCAQLGADPAAFRAGAVRAAGGRRRHGKHIVPARAGARS